MNKIHTSNAPAAIGPYSQGIEFGELIFTSGQIPVDPKTGEVVGSTISNQARTALENLKAVLEAGGSSLDKIFKTTCFIADMNDFAEFNKIYATYITGAPARSCVAVKTLPKNVLCEIEAIACKK